MDVLSEVLKVVKLDSAIFFNCEFSAPWCFYSPGSPIALPFLSPTASRVIIYHMLLEGRAYLRTADAERHALVPGDIVTVPHGQEHYLGNGETEELIDGTNALPGLIEHGLELVRVGGGGETSLFICGFLACDGELCHAFFKTLPTVVKVNVRDDDSGRWLENSLKFSVQEAVAGRDGSKAMLAKLSELAFIETLRRYVRDLPQQQTGWLAGARDPVVGSALALLHKRHAHPWTITELAGEVGLSRSSLADRFRHYIGEPPMAYLTNWRLLLGARLLLSTNRSVADVAGEVGYESEASFNRAFKRKHGVPPARYRGAARAGAAPQRLIPQ